MLNSEEATNTNFIVISIDPTEARTPNQHHLRRAGYVNSIISWLVILNLNESVLNIQIFLNCIIFSIQLIIYGHIVTRQVPHLEQELLILPVFSGFHLS